jgi:hypothetical protein
VSKFGVVGEIDDIKKTLVKLLFLRDVGFGDFGNWLGWLKSGKQFRGTLGFVKTLRVCVSHFCPKMYVFGA